MMLNVLSTLFEVQGYTPLVPLDYRWAVLWRTKLVTEHLVEYAWNFVPPVSLSGESSVYLGGLLQVL